MLLEDLNWMDVERYLERDDRIVLITGACEQHGYLSLLSDIRAPLAIAQAACQKEGVLIAPPFAYGVSPYFTTYPGTVSLRPETFAMVARDIVEGLVAQGFRRILASNGHGGNSGILVAVLLEASNAHPDTRMGFFEWWRHPKIEALSDEVGLPLHHANWSENFAFTRVADVPDGDKAPPDVPRTASAKMQRALLGDGSFGGPYQAPDDVMARVFNTAVAVMVEELRKLRE
jgi:creatinine amidohydrolase